MNWQNQSTPRLTRSFLAAALVVHLSLGSSPAASQPDLRSPLQAVRDAAATALRTNYTPPSRTNWEAMLERVPIGYPFPDLNFTGLANSANQGRTENFVITPTYFLPRTVDNTLFLQLDDSWRMHVTLRDSSSNATGAQIVTARELELNLRPVFVPPPAKFTGTWTCYFPDGRVALTWHCENGLQEGEQTEYLPGDFKIVYNCTHNLRDGREIGYFPSGQVEHVGISKTGEITPGRFVPQPVGSWFWYNEDGTLKMRQDFADQPVSLPKKKQILVGGHK